MRAHRRGRLRDAQGGGEASAHRVEKGRRRLTFCGVSATACWTAYCRALEGDPLSRALLDDETTAIGRALEARVPVRAAVRSRTECMDRLIFQAISRRAVETIVTLGCGLDARPWRMEAAGVRWIDVDVPEVLAWKERRVDAVGLPRVRSIAADLSRALDVEAIARASTGPTLFVAEGLLQYLAPSRARSTLKILARRGAPTQLVADVGGGAWARIFGRVQRVARSVGAPYRTRVANVRRFFAAADWRVREVESLSTRFAKPWSAWLVPGWSRAASVVAAEAYIAEI